MNKTAFLFVLAASLIMTGFNTIPHHHHGQKVCFERVHDNDNKEPHNENDCNSPDNCILNQITDTPPDRVNVCFHSTVFKNPAPATDQHQNHLTALLTINAYYGTPSPPLIAYIAGTETISCLYSLLFSSGLRAPPSV